jgi:hypothetical protein
MASAYRPFGPSTGPGSYFNMLPFNNLSTLGFGTDPGYGFTSYLGPNSWPNPGPPAPQTDNGILLEGSWNEFIALELSLGGPTDHLVMQP